METDQVLNSLRHELRRKGQNWRDIRGGVALEFRDAYVELSLGPIGIVWVI